MEKIIRVFPRRTSHTPNDDYVFIGDQPLDRPTADEVHISCTFTWDKSKAERLKMAWSQYYPNVKIGGPAYDDPGNGFTPGMYIKNGIITTSRGCNNQCPPCLAWQREGPIRENKIIEVGNILQDNNILQCNKDHQENVFDMLLSQHGVRLTGGIQSSLITDYIAERIRSLRLKEIFLACDYDDSIKPLRKAMKKLKLTRESRKARCYVLLKYDPCETINHALMRLFEVWDTGCIPFAQLYQPPDQWIDYPKEWTRFARRFQRPAESFNLMQRIEKMVTK